MEISFDIPSSSIIKPGPGPKPGIIEKPNKLKGQNTEKKKEKKAAQNTKVIKVEADPEDKKKRKGLIKKIFGWMVPQKNKNKAAQEVPQDEVED